MNWVQVVTIILGSSALSVLLNYHFTKRIDLRKFKENKYANLLELIKNAFYDNPTKESKDKFYTELYKAWLYSSASVIKEVNNLASSAGKKIEKDPFGKVVLEMRRDLNLTGAIGLSEEDLNLTNVIDNKK